MLGYFAHCGEVIQKTGCWYTGYASHETVPKPKEREEKSQFDRLRERDGGGMRRLAKKSRSHAPSGPSALHADPLMHMAAAEVAPSTF